MKKSIIFGILGVVLAGGAGTGVSYMTQVAQSSSPEQIAVKYIEALKEGDYETAYSCTAVWGEALTYTEFVEMADASGLAKADPDTIVLSENETDEYNNTIITGTVETEGTGIEVMKEEESESEEEDKDSRLKFQMVKIEAEKGMFAEWRVELLREKGEAESFTVTVPAGSVLLLNDYAAADLGATVKPTQKGDVYTFTDVAFEEYEIKVGSNFFETYTETIDPSEGEIDITKKMKPGENSRITMENLGKEALEELFKAAYMDSDSWRTNAALKSVTTTKALIQNIKSLISLDEDMKVNAIRLDSFKPEFSEPVYSADGASVITEMTLTSTEWYWLVKESVAKETLVEGGQENQDEDDGDKAVRDLQAETKTGYKFSITWKNGSYTINSIIQTDAVQSGDAKAIEKETEAKEETAVEQAEEEEEAV